jgi:putative transposase
MSSNVGEVQNLSDVISLIFQTSIIMKKHTTEPLEPDKIYHIYNRGINGENIFKEERNYSYFLEKYAKCISPIADTYAYCLLKNHFHLAVKIKNEQEILDFYLTKKNNVGEARSLPDVKNDVKIPDVTKIINQQFAVLFNGYAQAINKAFNRTGGLFEESFRRILVDNDHYFTELIYYIHHNPQKHGFVNDFRDYPHSSYHSHLSMALTKLRRDEVLAWFGNRNEYEKFHIGNQNLNHLDKFNIEFE